MMHAHGSQEVAVADQSIDILLLQPRIIEGILDCRELKPVVAELRHLADPALPYADDGILVLEKCRHEQAF